jgi:hypothetical protein
MSQLVLEQGTTPRSVVFIFERRQIDDTYDVLRRNRILPGITRVRISRRILSFMYAALQPKLVLSQASGPVSFSTRSSFLR